ncbi:MAG: hypothetical protein AAF739_16715 [Pseudomonadota bacterium]
MSDAPEQPTPHRKTPQAWHPGAYDKAPNDASGRVSFTLVVLRLFVCSLSFVVAVVAASALGTFAMFRGLEQESAYGVAFLSAFGFGTLAIAAQVLVPFAALIILTESFALRSVLVFSLAGLAIGVYEITDILGEGAALADPRVMIAAAAGAVGGSVYWLLAGRKAGDFRERRYHVSQQRSHEDAGTHAD